MQESFRVSAPGKLFLLGEHAVLHNKKSIICAINQRIFIYVKPRKDSKIVITSALGDFTTTLEKISIKSPFTFILTAIDSNKHKLSNGFEIDIISEFSSTVGLGSSAAVTAAMTAAIFQLANENTSKRNIFDNGFSTIRKVQGSGSGADLAASVYGGLLLYRLFPLDIKPLKNLYPVTVIYSGTKQSTTQVIKIVQEKETHFPTIYNNIFSIMEQSSEIAAQAINNNDWSKVGLLLNLNQGLMDAIGVNNKTLSDIVYTMRKDPAILGSKISGSGLGDCVVGLGQITKEIEYDILPIQMTQDGVKID